MKHLKTICIMLVIALFALQTTASIALAACNCADMQEQTMQMDGASGDMPCHDMDTAEANTSSDDSQMTDCDSCGCGHCVVTASAALNNPFSAGRVVSADTVTLSADSTTKSLFPYGIDYPPKPIS